MVTLTIDNLKVTVPNGTTILTAANKLGIKIPTLCYDPRLSKVGACRICSVEVKGARSLVTACTYPVAEGMEVRTNSRRVRESRKTIVELLLANHPDDCLRCARNNNCDLQRLAIEYDIRERKWEGAKREFEIDNSSTSIVKDPAKCILCGKCVRMCREIQQVSAIDFTRRGFNKGVETAFHKPLADSVCILCGQCLLVCPTAAIQDKSMIDDVIDKLDDPDTYVTVQVAPSIRASIGEEFGLKPGTLVTKQLVTALKRIGFDQVFDTDFGADVTIMEEGTEFISRLKNDGPFPMFTSCSPGWIKFMEHFYPEYMERMSTCKSPQQITGILTKTYFAEKANIDPKKIYNVSIMPCSAKKFEIERPEMQKNGIKDVDAVLTTREAARLIRIYGMTNFDSLPDSEFDAPLGITTGAGVIFGTTGGVMEAALRTVSEIVTGKPLEKVELKEVRGFEGIREATVNLDGKEIKVAAAHGLGNVRKVMDAISRGEKNYHFVEIMTCPGGCVGGGGQPIPTDTKRRLARIKAIYKEDEGMEFRQSHKNPAVEELYKTYLDEPNSHKSHELLHTTYTQRKPVGI